MNNINDLKQNNGIVKQSMSKEEWEDFVHNKVVNFMMENNIEKINIEDGSGKKANVKRESNGNWKRRITYDETF